MRLLINSAAATYSSLGVRRFYLGTMRHVVWPAGVTLTALPGNAPAARLTELLLCGRVDSILWSPSQRGPLNARHHVVTIHDCINVEYTFRNDWRLPFFRKLFNIVLANAEVIAPVSQATADAVLRNYDVDASKIVVIPGGIEWPAPDSEPPGNTVNAEPPFVLMVTNALPHKNTVLACQAFAASDAARDGVTLRVVGSIAPEAMEICRSRGVRLELPGRVSDRTLYGWYRSCALLLGPSLDEGYDLPVAEAIAVGCKVLCSEIPVHREFYAQQARFFDPLHVDALVHALNEAIRADAPGSTGAVATPPRSYREVAADYTALFQRMAAGVR